MTANLQERFEKEDIIYLVTMVENPSDYSPEVFEIALEAIKMRDADISELKAIAKDIVTKKCEILMRNFSPFNDKLLAPKSNFLNEEECLQLLKSVFDEYMLERDAKAIDVWSYAIGGI